MTAAGARPAGAGPACGPARRLRRKRDLPSVRHVGNHTKVRPSCEWPNNGVRHEYGIGTKEKPPGYRSTA